MKRPARILLTAATIVSLVLCAGSAVLWLTMGDKNALTLGRSSFPTVSVEDWRLCYENSTQSPWSHRTWSLPGLSVEAMQIAPAVGRSPPWYRVRYGLSLAYLLIAPAFAAFRALERRMLREFEAERAARGRCRSCGYDLRATPDRCPECGTIPANP